MEKDMAKDDIIAMVSDIMDEHGIERVTREMLRNRFGVRDSEWNRYYDTFRELVEEVKRFRDENGKTDSGREKFLDRVRYLLSRDGVERVTRNILRKKYGIADSEWERHFGTFSELKAALGVDYRRGDRRALRFVSGSNNAETTRAFTNERLEWSDRFVRHDNGKRYKTIIVGSDFHDRECDDFALRMFLHACDGLQPDIIILNGDVFDLPEFGKYTVDFREWDIVGRISTGLDIIGKIRETCPNSQIDFIEGNHEARLIKFLGETSPQMRELLWGLHDMTIGKLLRLDDYEVNYIAHLDLAAHTDAGIRREIMLSESIYYDTVMIRHHPPTKGQIQMPGVNGHEHKHVVFSGYHPRYGSFEWHQTGGMRRRYAGYGDGGIKWNVGFIYGFVDTLKERVQWTYVSVGDTICYLGGRLFERGEDEYHPMLEKELSMFREGVRE